MNHRSYLFLAVPLILSAMTTPLIGAVDTAVVGQLSNPAYIGGVAVGTILFNTMYWLLGFLRVSTSAFTAQAHGANNENLIILSFVRPLLMAAAAGTLFILFQEPIAHLTMNAINPSSEVKKYALAYIDIRIWGAPFALINYVILGWLIGLSRIKEAFYLQVLMNGLNIFLDLLFVHSFSWGVFGVAAATLIAEIMAVGIGVLLIFKSNSLHFKIPPFKEVMDFDSFIQMLNVNRDLFIRTICLLIMFNLFTKLGASFGTEILAANAILIQVHYLMAYFFDGFANASSILTGRAIGSNDKKGYEKTVSISFAWSIYSAAFLTLVYFIVKDRLIGLFTQIQPVAELAMHYGNWLLLYPITACFGLVFYGVFTGATSAAPVRNSMIYSLISYVIVLFFSFSMYENHGLWFAFLVFSFGRSLFLLMYLPRLNKSLFQRKSVAYY